MHPFSFVLGVLLTVVTPPLLAAESPTIVIKENVPRGAYPGPRVNRTELSTATPRHLGELGRPNIAILLPAAQTSGEDKLEGFDVNACTTQSNLDDVGKTQADERGAAWIRAGIFPSRVWSSAQCRGIETARRLNMGMPGLLPDLNAASAGRPLDPNQVSRLRAFVERLDPYGGPYVLVTDAEVIRQVTPQDVPSDTGVAVVLLGNKAAAYSPLPVD